MSESINQEIRIAELRLNELREKKAREEAADIAARRKPLRAIAKGAHDLLCRWNHTDGCGWGYEEGSDPDSDACWSGHAHSRWLGAVEGILSEKRWPSALTPEDLNALIDSMRQALSVHRDALAVVDDLRRLS